MSSPVAAPSIIYLGMDVHKDSITIAVLPATAKSPTPLERLPNDLPKLKRCLDRLARDSKLRPWAVPHGERRLLLPAHHRGSAHALPADLPRAPLDGDVHGEAGVRARLPRVRPAARDPHRQRGAVRDAGDSRAVVPQRLVDAVRHRASAHSSGGSRRRTGRTSGCTGR